MGHRAEKKYNKSNADILEELEYLAEVTRGIEYDTELIRHKLNQMDSNVCLVMENQCATLKGLNNITKKQDRLLREVGRVETAQGRLMRRADEFERMLFITSMVCVASVIAAALILA